MIKADDGSVSLYLMIILSVFLLLFTVFADFARIWLAGYHLDNAVRAAVRSGLSEFDEQLQVYGLFGMAAESHNRETVMDVLNGHLSYTPGDGAFQLAHIEAERVEVRVDPAHTLSNHDVLKRQILEEMKYMAPIEFSLAVIDKFDRSGARAVMQKATTFYRQIEKVEELRMQREAELDKAWAKLQNWIGANGETWQFVSFYEERFGRMQQLAAKIGSYTEPEVQNIILELEEELLALQFAVESINASISAIASSGAELTEAQQWMIRTLSEQRNQLNRQMSEVREQLSELREILEAIREFHRLAEGVPARLADASRRLIAASSEWTEHWSKAKLANRDMADLLDNLEQGGEERKQLTSMKEQLVIPAIYFQRLESDAGTLVTLTENVERKYAPGTFRTGDDFSPIYPSLVEALNTLRAHASEFYGRQSAIEAERQAQNRSSEAEKDEVNGKISAVIQEVKELLYECGENDDAVYEHLKQLEGKYKTLNSAEYDGDDESLTPPDLEDTIAMPRKAMHLLERLQQAFLNIRDDVYVNEYVLYYLNYRTYGKNNKPVVHPSSRPDRHPLLRQEAEYVLYGFSSCRANHIAAFSQIFAVRLGIRTMEALLDPKSAARATPHPLLVFLYAALDGAKKALQDIKQLIEGKEVPLSALFSPSITLNYKDYLRLFLALPANQTRRLSRLQALIEWNSGRLLEEKYTYVEAEAEVSVRLWVLPAKQKRIVKTAGWWY